MVNSVRIYNRTAADIAFGSRVVPAMGCAVIGYAEYISVLSDSYVNRSGLYVEMGGRGLSDVSVRDFGAKGDGFSDDTYAVQSAIDFVGSLGGGVVRFPVGVYPVSHISVMGNISLAGESRLDSVVKALKRSSDTILSIEGADASISDLRFVV